MCIRNLLNHFQTKETGVSITKKLNRLSLVVQDNFMTSVREQLFSVRLSKLAEKQNDEDFVEEAVLQKSQFISPRMSVGNAIRSWKLNPLIAQNLACEGVTDFFPIQRAVIPHLIQNNSRRCLHTRDICASAPTGSGKTIAYVLPIVNTLCNMPTTVKRLRALIMLPSRELAMQVGVNCIILNKYCVILLF